MDVSYAFFNVAYAAYVAYLASKGAYGMVLVANFYVLPMSNNVHAVILMFVLQVEIGVVVVHNVCVCEGSLVLHRNVTKTSCQSL